MSNPGTPAQSGGGSKKLLILVVAILGLAAGVVVPMVMGGGSSSTDPEAKDKKAKAAKDKSKEEKTFNVPFGEVVVNLSEDRMSRYLRLKMVVKVAMADEKTATTLVTDRKAAMKNWLLGHLAGKTLKDVGGTVGVKKIQREIFDKFEEMLEIEAPHRLVDVLFEEYLVQ